MTKSFEVVGIGNAIIDILAYVSDDFLVKNQIKKGVMNLINSERSNELFRKISITKKVAGGSAANTIVGLSQLGIKTSYFGKVSNDEFGKFFTDDLNSNNIAFDVSEKYQAYAAGVKAARKMIPEIKREMKRKHIDYIK